MKEKLKKFKTFAQTLLPHESKYLSSIQQFQDEEKLSILNTLIANAENTNGTIPFDPSIDKRKYSYIKRWIQNELNKIDVDNKYIWISKVQQDILLDRIIPEDEATILKSLKVFTNTAYYFTKHYEMLIDLRHYLLIRRRHTEYKKVDAYINEYTFDYQGSLLVNQQMDQATKEIMNLDSNSSQDADKWEAWLINTFKNDQLDGLNRYMAFVRLSYYYLHKNKLNKLEETYRNVQPFFENGQYYSRRLLLNFYDNSLVLYDRKKEYQTASYYGMLSIKGTGPDQLLYFNNFINILMKQEKYNDAIQLINSKTFKISEFKDDYSVIGYVANHIRCLLKTNHLNHALNKANVFWENNKTKIFEYRWHRFFSAYLETLLANKEYLKITRLVRRYKLIPLERERVEKHQPSNRLIEALYNIALYHKGETPKKDILEKLKEFHVPGLSALLDNGK